MGVGVTRRGRARSPLSVRRTLDASRTFLVGCGKEVLKAVTTMIVVVTNFVKCGRFVSSPGRMGTSRTLFGKRRCFKTSGFRATLGNSDVNCGNFLGMTSRFDKATTNGLTGTCTNVYCTRLNGCRSTIGCLSGFDTGSRLIDPTVLKAVNGYCTRVKRLSGTTKALLGTTSGTSDRTLDPVCLVRTNRLFRGLNGGDRTIGTCALIGRGCFGSCRSVSVSGCVRHTSVGWRGGVPW